jgi:oligogalacturonide lyase
MKTTIIKTILLQVACLLTYFTCHGQIGSRFPSERKIVKDPVTGVDLVFLTSTPAGDSKIYPTHNQWTSDGNWLIFRSDRVKGEAMAVNEKTGDIVQVTEGGYSGALCVARKSMRLFYWKKTAKETENGSQQLIEVDLEKLFTDSKEGMLEPANSYQRACGTAPKEMNASTEMALDADEEWVYFSVGKSEAERHLPEGTKIEEPFGPRKMGAGPGGIAGMNVNTGEIKYVVSVPFQIGHVQSNSWKSGEIIFCWETGGKAPQRTWIVNADGTGLRPLYPESKYEWVTHEAVIGRDEVAIAIMGHRPIPESSLTTDKDATGVYGANPGQETEWGPCGTREKPTGLGIVNLRTREMTIAGQTPQGSGLWHVSGSSDGRFATGDDFDRNLYLIDRKTREMVLLSAGHKSSAKDHVHPTFSPDGTKIQIQSAMLSEDDKSMNICIVPVPKKRLKRK